MPTYQYACTQCDHAFDQFQSFSDDALTVCPRCQGRLRKVFNAVGVVFKGSGFYRTDSRTPPADGKPVTTGSGSGSSSSGDGAGTGSSGDAGGSGSSSDSGGSGSSGDTKKVAPKAESGGSKTSDRSGGSTGSKRSTSSKGSDSAA